MRQVRRKEKGFHMDRVKKRKKKRRNESCVYCGLQANSKDHVPPRCLLEKPYPKNLITVPACKSCNNDFSRDEQYFMVVLSQIGTSDVLKKKVEKNGVIDRALTRAPLLDQRIIDALKVDPEGKVFIEPEQERIRNVVQKVAFGIFITRYEKIPRFNEIEPVEAFPYNIKDYRPIDVFLNTFSERFRGKRWETMQQSIFSYIVVRDFNNRGKLCCVIDFHSTIWGVAYFPYPQSIPPFTGKKGKRRSAGQLQLKFE